MAIGELNQALDELPRRLERLRKSGLKKLSRSDEDARFLRQRGGFVLGYTGQIAVAAGSPRRGPQEVVFASWGGGTGLRPWGRDDHLIVAQRVTQNATDNESLAPMIDEVRQRCGAPPAAALADSGFFSVANLEEMEQQKIDGYVPDWNPACELNLGARCRRKARAAAHRRMRAKLRSPAGQAAYARRKAVVEPVFGVLKQQRGMRQFRTRGLEKVSGEFTLPTLAYNITRRQALLAA